MLLMTIGAEDEESRGRSFFHTEPFGGDQVSQALWWFGLVLSAPGHSARMVEQTNVVFLRERWVV